MSSGNLSGVNMTFKRSLEEFIAVDDEMKKMSAESKELRKNKKILEDAISNHMVDNDLEEQSFEQSRVKVFKKKTSSNSFTRANVTECALLLLGSEKCDALIKMIDGLKETTESTGIKRIKGEQS